MSRRKNKKQRRQQAEKVFESSIEDDIRNQRTRQQQREAEAEKKRQEEKPAPPKEEDQEIEILAPLPIRPQHLMLKGMTSPLEDLTKFSSLTLQMSLERSPFLLSHHQSRLRKVWHSKHLLEQIGINSRASTLYSRKLKWLDLSFPNGMHGAWDMACKHNLHPSARTMDVASLHDGQLPTIATTAQGGWGLFQPPRGREPRVQTLRGKPVHAIRLHEKSGVCGTVVRWNGRYAPYKFQWYPLPHATSCLEADLFEPVHDFCFGNDLVLFACPRFKGGATLSPLFLPLDRHDTGLRSLNVRNFPQSDALRVEMTCDHEKYVSFGHRNGQVSMLDLRQSHSCCSILQHEPALGSATDVAFLSSGKHLLVKRSFGSCQLHDLRKVTTAKSNTPLIYNLTVPDGQYHRTLSANCNGFAVDPRSGQTLISPYVDAKQETRLGVWSLGTGAMVGSKVLAHNVEKDVVFTEVCQRTSPAFTATNAVDSSSFGVWLKCGRFSTSKINSKVGSLHHVTFPGSWQ